MEISRAYEESRAAAQRRDVERAVSLQFHKHSGACRSRREPITVVDFAQGIEEQRIVRAAPTELTEMLRALEDLSDEEVEALLASEERPTAGRPAVGADEVRS
jgi:hypothetical protein